MSIVNKIYLGIDWGTHSSKWAALIDAKDGKKITKSNLIRSDLLFHDSKITINPSDNYYPEMERTISLKRLMINDPFGAFWESGKEERQDIGMPLGMGVVFSICSLFSDFLRFVERENMVIDSNTYIELGFSFPNWLRDKDKKSRAAVNNYHQAIYISCFIFKSYKDKLPLPNKSYSVIRWKELVKESREVISIPQDKEIKIANMTTLEYNLGAERNNFKWRYLVESCAAGLPYLRNIALESPPGVPGLGKLLVVDVGAGSTDIGYMLRTLTREKKTENLFYFSPAPTLDIAGNDLTEKIKDYFDSTGRSITFAEAEAYKITNSTEWKDKSFASIWRQTIRNSIKEYIKVIPDYRWLAIDVPLQIIITGGSGLVQGLSEEIKTGVSEGLIQRGFNHKIGDNVNLIEKVLTSWQFRTKEDYARRAVAIGSADKNKPALKYLDKMDPPTGKMIYIPAVKYK